MRFTARNGVITEADIRSGEDGVVGDEGEGAELIGKKVHEIRDWGALTGRNGRGGIGMWLDGLFGVDMGWGLGRR